MRKAKQDADQQGPGDPLVPAPRLQQQNQGREDIDFGGMQQVSLGIDDRVIAERIGQPGQDTQHPAQTHHSRIEREQQSPEPESE